MPDLDKVERKLPRGWRAPYRLVKGCHPPEEVAKAVFKAISRTLREQGGAPRFGDFANILRQRDAGLLDNRSLSSVALRIDQQMFSRTGKLAVAALLRPEVSGPTSIRRGGPEERLAQGILERMVENVLFSQQRDYLIGKCFTSRQEAIAFENQLMSIMQPGLARMARHLVKDPSAKRLRAPSLVGSRKSTAELLDQPL